MDCQGTCDVPHAPTGAARRKGARRLTKRPGLLSDLHAHWERFGEHERKEEHVEPGTESIRNQVCASGKS